MAIALNTNTTCIVLMDITLYDLIQVFLLAQTVPLALG